MVCHSWECPEGHCHTLSPLLRRLDLKCSSGKALGGSVPTAMVSPLGLAGSCICVFQPRQRDTPCSLAKGISLKEVEGRKRKLFPQVFIWKIWKFTEKLRIIQASDMPLSGFSSSVHSWQHSFSLPLSLLSLSFFPYVCVWCLSILTSFAEPFEY